MIPHQDILYKKGKEVALRENEECLTLRGSPEASTRKSSHQWVPSAVPSSGGSCVPKNQR